MLLISQFLKESPQHLRIVRKNGLMTAKTTNTRLNGINHISCPFIAQKKQNFKVSNLSCSTCTEELLPVISSVYKIGVSSTDTCTFCEQNTKTLIHLFWYCDFVQTFWQRTQHWLIQHQIKPQNVSLTLPLCLSLVENAEDILMHH